MVIGMTQRERILAIVIEPEPEAETYYVVTARTADHKERRIYQAEQGEGGEKAA